MKKIISFTFLLTSSNSIYTQTLSPMKKIILSVFSILVFPIFINAQSVRLGYTSEKIRNEFGSNIFPDEKFMFSNNKPFLSMMENGCLIDYYFENDICTSCLVIPESDEIANKLIAYYNKNYVREYLDKSHLYWTAYSSTANTKINFIQNEKGMCFYYYQ